MLKHDLVIGLLPMRRNTTNRPAKTFLTWVSAEERGNRFVKYIKENFTNDHVKFVDTEGLGCADLIFDEASAETAVERFKAAGVDAVLMINTNFGNEEVCADIAKAIGKPFAIWAPLDDEYYEHGMRPTDSQCGIFGVSRQMQRYNIPFSYIPCCRVESDTFAESFDSFVRVACMVKNFTGLRIGQVGIRPAPFFSVIWNESELMTKFGVKITPINLAILQDRFNKTKEEKKDEVAKFVQVFKDNYQMDELTPQYLERMACLVVTYIGIFEEFKLDVISAECWTATPAMFDGLAPCAVYGILNDLGYIISCESDMHCAMTMVLLESAALGEKRPFLGEFTVRHPENPNAELLWHCGPFPLSVKKDGCEACLPGGKPSFQAKDGIYTIARFQGDEGNYTLFGGKFKTVDGPKTFGTYLWAEFNDLAKLERKMVEGPYIHHMTEIAGDYTDVLQEFCKYIPALTYDPAE